MNQRSKKDFDEDVEKAATFLRVNCSQRGKLLVNQKSKQLFLETPNTKRIIPLGSWYYQLEGAPSLKDLPDVVLLNKRAKKDFDKDVEKATTFLLVNHSKEGNLLVNQKSEELFLETSNTKRIIQLGSCYYQLGGAPSLKDLPVYPLD